MALYQHRFIGTTPLNERWEFTWWSDSASSLSAIQAEAVTWANTLWDGAVAGAGLEDHLRTVMALNTVRTGEINIATGQQLTVAETAVTRAGLAATQQLPATIAVCVSLRTNQANRSGRGRFFLPGPTVADVTGSGEITAGFINDITASLDAAWTAYNAVGTPVVYSRLQRATNVIQSFDIGNLYDRITSRTDGLTEARTSVVMP